MNSGTCWRKSEKSKSPQSKIEFRKRQIGDRWALLGIVFGSKPEFAEFGEVATAVEALTVAAARRGDRKGQAVQTSKHTARSRRWPAAIAGGRGYALMANPKRLAGAGFAIRRDQVAG